MSTYRPDVRGLYASKERDGWWVCDGHGLLDGPYENQRFALEIIEAYVEAEGGDHDP